MTGLLEGKVSLVTGGASGIGRSTCLALAREGARVLACDVDEGAGEKLSREITDGGGEARFLRVDVTRETDVEAAVKTAVEGFGRLDCAVNNAGITGTGGMIHELSSGEFARVLGVNLSGVFLCLKHEIPVMQEQGGGAIVNMASGAGLIAVPGLAHYCASKHAVLGLTKTAALENARTGVRVNAVCPGSIDTPLLQATIGDNPTVEKMVLKSQPGGRLGTPEEIAESVVWLLSDRASFVTGHSMLVDGGQVAR